jgi:hypothetical protein
MEIADMPLNETDKAWVRENIKAAHERRGWGKLTGAIKDWSGAGAAIAILILAVTQWTAYIEFRTQTTDRLGMIEKKLTTSELQSQASLPQSAFEKALPEVRSTVATARKDGISVPPAVIEGLRSKLLASNSATPDFWPTLSEFVSYRSALSYHATAAPTPMIRVFSLSTQPNCTDSLPKPMTIKEVVSPNEAINNRGLYENCRFELDSATQGQTLNAILRGKTPFITFKNCLIVYYGGEISLILAWDKEPFTMTIVGRGPEDPSKIIHTTLSGPAIQFENCLFNLTFQNSPPPNGQRLSTTLLAQNPTSVSLPVSP